MNAVARLSPEDLDRLEALLSAPHLQDSMTLDALQGFFCAVASAPAPIPPEKWMGFALGEHQFASDAEAREVADLLTRFAADTARYSSLPERWRRDGFDVAPAVYGTNLAAVVRSASVVYGESASHRVAGYWSDRVYRVLGLEGFFVTRYTPGLETFFRDGEHLVWFRRDDALAPLVRRWLEDPEGRQRNAREGRRHVLAHHTYDHRAAEMLSHLETLGSR